MTWLQPPGPYIGPSTHPQTHHDTVGSPPGCNKAEFPVISEAGLDGRKSYIKSADISCGLVAGGYPGHPTPNRQGRKFWWESTNTPTRGERIWILASSITSTKARASSPERRPTTSTPVWSEKMDVIREMRSCSEREYLINRFQAGRPLRTGHS